ncbi:MAG: hypothetical protein U1E53_02640 [Dongiaceae bacterium]
MCGAAAGLPGGRPAVTVTDGQYHTVDSSDMAFEAARMAMTEAWRRRAGAARADLPVTIAVPSDFTRACRRRGRRGQILGFDAKDG